MHLKPQNSLNHLFCPQFIHKNSCSELLTLHECKQRSAPLHKIVSQRIQLLQAVTMLWIRMQNIRSLSLHLNNGLYVKKKTCY